MQRNHVASFKYIIEGSVVAPHVLSALMRGHEDFHSERLGNTSSGQTQSAIAYNAKHGAGQIIDGVVKV